MHAGKLFTIALAVLTVPLAPGVALGDGLDGHGSAAAEPLSPAATVERVAGGVLEHGLLDKLEDGSRGVIVHFEDAVPANLADLPGIQPSYTFQSIPAAYVLADAGGVGTLGVLDGVTFVEDAEKSIEFHLETATVATRAKEVYDLTFTAPETIIDETDTIPTRPDGSAYDGSGVGIAVVDSGLDGTHPDFQAPGKQAGNYIVTPEGLEDGGQYTAQGSSHGTHVAGIAAGTGAGSVAVDGPDRRGAAPGASLYTFATWFPTEGGNVKPTTIAPAMAFDWILQNGDDQDPPIRVVVNAWSCSASPCTEANPQQAHLQLASQLAEAGDVVLFSVGNAGGSGLEALTSPESRITTPGVLGIGAADDEEIGNRNDCTKGISSRGHALQPATWPDLIAPGDEVWSPQALGPDPDSRVPVPENPAEASRKVYTASTGTSAAVGHIGGVVALMLEANPALAPEGVSYLLKETAHKPADETEVCGRDFYRADDTHPWGSANWAAGHGIVDTVDAVIGGLAFTGLPTSQPELEVVPEDAISIGPTITNLHHTFYMNGTDELSQELPSNDHPEPILGTPGDWMVFTSPPLDEAFTTGGVYVHAYVGTLGEWFVSNSGFVVMEVYRLPVAGGSPELIAYDDDSLTHAIGPGPYAREGAVVLPEPATFEQGDQVQVRLIAGLNSEREPLSHYVVYTGGAPIPSRVLFGDRIESVLPGSNDLCVLRRSCIDIGGPVQYNTYECDDDFLPHHVAWYGPAGSRATVNCFGSVATCTIPGDEGDPWGRCSATALRRNGSTGEGQCTYYIPGGGMGGQGHCAKGPAPEA